MYQDYVSESQVSAALAVILIRPGKTTMEVAYNESNAALVGSAYVGHRDAAGCRQDPYTQSHHHRHLDLRHSAFNSSHRPAGCD
jgi:hypothetical protein